MKCHSWRLSSARGAAWKLGFGCGEEAESSFVSRSRRRIVGEGAMLIANRVSRCDVANHGFATQPVR